MAVNDESATTRPAAKREPAKPSRAAAIPVRPVGKWSVKKLGLVSLACGAVGFLLAWIPILWISIVGVAVCALGGLVGAASLVLSVWQRQWDIALAAAGLSASFIGGVIGYVVTASKLKG